MHYPGTYAHGVYNRETTILGGGRSSTRISSTCPNWLVLKLRIEGEDAIRLADVELLSYRHELDIRTAVVDPRAALPGCAGRETALRSRRFVSMAHSHQAGIEWTLTPENWSGRVEVVSAIDGRVTNGGVARYRELEGRHLDPVSPRNVRPRDHRAEGPDAPVEHLRRRGGAHARLRRRGLVAVRAHACTRWRTTSSRSSRSTSARASRCASRRWWRSTRRATARSARRWRSAGKSVRLLPGLRRGAARHHGAWEELWRVCDVHVPGDERRPAAAAAAHLPHPAGLLAAHDQPRRRGAGARPQRRGLPRPRVLGRALRLSVPDFRLPEITRELLMYRYRRLGEARAAAREAGFQGAMFPWQSGSDGTEETQTRPPQPAVGAVGAGPQP